MKITLQMLIKVVALLGLSSIPTQLCLADSEDQLVEIVNEGLRNAYDIKSQQLKLEQSRNLLKNSYYNLLPKVTLSGGRTITTTESQPSGYIQADTTAQSSASAAASWTLFDNYQSIRNIQTSEATYEVTQKQTRKQVQSYILNLLNLYLQYQLLLSQKITLEDSLKQNKWTQEESAALVAAGARTKLDSMDAEIAVVTTERDLLELNNSIDSSERNIFAILNSDRYKKLPVIDLIKLKPFYMKDFDKRISSIREQAKRDLESVNPDLQIAHRQLDISLMNLKQTKLGYWPSTNLVLSHSVDLSNLVQAPAVGMSALPLNTSSIQLQFSWQLWDWWITPRNIDNAQKDYEISRFQYKQALLQTNSDVQNSIDAYDVLEKSIYASNLALDKAKIQMSYSREMFRLGRITLLVMQQSVSRFRDAQIALATRMESKYILAAQILDKMGYELMPN